MQSFRAKASGTSAARPANRAYGIFPPDSPGRAPSQPTVTTPRNGAWLAGEPGCLAGARAGTILVRALASVRGGCPVLVETGTNEHPARLKVGIVGPGRAGTALSRARARAGHEVVAAAAVSEQSKR